MTDLTAEPASSTTTDHPKMVVRLLAEGLGYVVIALIALYGIYSMGKPLFYDVPYNQGFEAGRASMCRYQAPGETVRGC